MKKNMTKKIQNWINDLKLKLMKTSNAGFTLTEMLIVVALIAMVGAFVGSQLIGKYNRAKADGTRIQMRSLMTSLDQFKMDCGFFPTQEQGLEALIEKPTGGRECKRYDPEGYLKNKKLPVDGFNNEFVYEADGSKYVLKSLGADNAEGGEDLDSDILSSDL